VAEPFNALPPAAVASAVGGGAYGGDMRPTTDLQRTVAPFRVESEFQPAGDQPAAIAELARRVNAGEQDVVLLGATGTGKSATTAWLIEQVQRPTLVMAPNKTLAAQLANEFRELLPHNAVEYFRQLLRLLPARGLRPADRHLHREGLVDQRRGRAPAPQRHQLAADPP
jgi:RecG-like helicase